jgi:HK97 family phage major capsid protein
MSDKVTETVVTPKEEAVFDPAAIVAGLERAIDKMIETKLPKEETKREIVKQEEDHRSDIEIKEDKFGQVAKMFSGLASRKHDLVRASQFELARAGEYGGKMKAQARQSEVGTFSTIEDTEGGVLLPTLVSSLIIDIAKSFGVVDQYATSLPLSGFHLRVPNVTGDLTAYATSEGGEIFTDKFLWGGVELRLKKWAVIVPWTSEIDEDAGSALMPKISEKLAEAFAKAKDSAAIFGDGSATYNTITGITETVGVGTLPITGATSFTAGDHNDLVLHNPLHWLALKFQVTAGARRSGIYVIHPDIEQYLWGMKDGDGTLVYRKPGDASAPATLWGRPVAFTEAMPNEFSEGVIAAVYGNFSYLLNGQGRGLTTTLLTEGKIKTTDNHVDELNLATQDMKALRTTSRFDIKVGDSRAFAYMVLGGSS